MRRVRVLVADESAAQRARLIELLRTDDEVDVVGEAASGTDTVGVTKKLRPDIIAMDARLSSTGEFDATREIMADTPTPILILSDEADSQQGPGTAALHAGALAVVARPADQASADDQRFVSMVKAMSQVKVVRRWRERGHAIPEIAPAQRTGRAPRLIAVAASTGGPAALYELFSSLPDAFALPFLVVQHIGPGFTGGMVKWLSTACSMTFKLAEHGEPIASRTVYVAPDDMHLGVADPSTILLSNTQAIGGFRPSATFLYRSVADVFGCAAVHVILTGMGQDGVAGLKRARERGGTIIAQDPKTAVVGGMPGEAINAGLVDVVTPVATLARNLCALAKT